MTFKIQGLAAKLLMFAGGMTFIAATGLAFRYGTSSFEYPIIFFFVFALVIAVICIGSALLGKTVSTYTLITLVSLGSAATLADTFLSLTFKSPYVAYWEANGIDYDPRDRFDVFQDIQTQGDNNAVPAVMPSHLLDDLEFHSLLPLSGFTNRQTVYCNETGQFAIYHSDEEGFRNPGGLWKSKTSDIAILGDSFVHGACVQEGETIADHLRNKYPTTFNLGQGGNGALTAYATYKEYVQRLKPETILWVHTSGVLPRLKREAKHPILNSYLGDVNYTQKLSAQKNQVEQLLKTFLDRSVAIFQEERSQKFRHAIKDLLLLRNLRHALGLGVNQGLASAKGASDAIDPSQVNLTSQLLRQVRDGSAQWGGRVFFVFLSGKLDNPVTIAEREALFKTVSELDIEIIDVTAALEDQVKTNGARLWSAGEFGHYGPEGYRLAAKHILCRLERPNCP